MKAGKFDSDIERLYLGILKRFAEANYAIIVDNLVRDET